VARTSEAHDRHILSFSFFSDDFPTAKLDDSLLVSIHTLKFLGELVFDDRLVPLPFGVRLLGKHAPFKKLTDSELLRSRVSLRLFPSIVPRN